MFSYIALSYPVSSPAQLRELQKKTRCMGGCDDFLKLLRLG